MSYITAYPLRKPARYFGQDCQIEKLAHSAIEQARIETENAILRSDCASWKRQAQAALDGQAEIALRLAEVMERETALVSALSAYEAKEALLLARCERADNVATTQRLRIAELREELEAANTEILDREATISRIYMRAECDA